MYKFQKLTNARSFRNGLKGFWFIFNAPDSGYYVVNSKTAKELFAGGHKEVR